MAFARAQPRSADARSSLAGEPKGESACPPDDQGESNDSRGHAIADCEPTNSCDVVRLKRRSEFLAVAASERRWVAPAFVLQVGPRTPKDGVEVHAKGLLARAIQHELDHLDGVLLVDRMSHVKKVALGGKLKRLVKETKKAL